MKIFIRSEGDRIVGISGDEIIVDWKSLDNFLTVSEYRQEVRDSLREFWSGCLTSPLRYVSVHFEDECPQCLQPLHDGECYEQLLHFQRTSREEEPAIDYEHDVNQDARHFPCEHSNE